MTELMTLVQAATRYGLTVSALKTERARGRLTTRRIGQSQYVTDGDMLAMVEACRENSRRASTSTPEAGASETAQPDPARDALNQTLLALKRNSRNTSVTNTNRLPDRTH